MTKFIPTLLLFAATSAQADVVTYQFENTNLEGWYTFDRDTASVTTRTLTQITAETLVAKQYPTLIIDYAFTVNFPQFDYVESFTPDNSRFRTLANRVSDLYSTMVFRVESNNYANALRFDLFTRQVLHPYNNPFLDPADAFVSDYNLDAVTWDLQYLWVNDVDGRDYLATTSATVAVPLPASAWLFLSGAIGMAVVSRRRPMGDRMGAL